MLALLSVVVVVVGTVVVVKVGVVVAVAVVAAYFEYSLYLPEVVLSLGYCLFEVFQYKPSRGIPHKNQS